MIKTKITVITDVDGKVVGTQLGHAKDVVPDGKPHSRIVADNNQELHEIEIEIPDITSHKTDLLKYHEMVEMHIRGKKP